MTLRRSLPALAVALVAASLAPGSAHSAPEPARATSPLSSSFYTYSGATPLRDLPLGAVLKTRTVPYSIQGLSLPINATQVLYRTRDQVGRAVVNVTTVVKPIVPVSTTPKVLSYQSFYDSLNPVDEPSAVIAGASGLGAGNANVETLVFAPALLAGYTINIPDTEGQKADFAAGPEYGWTTLDSLRAISRASSTGVGSTAKIGLIGYSGGAIASEWAAQQAPKYAPRISHRIVGTALGGVLVHPGHNLHYIQGSLVWAGVMPMALVGLARAFHLDLAQYANAYGRSVMTKMHKATISQVLGAYPGLTWKKIAKARYTQPEQVPVFVRTANKLIMGRTGTPAAPLFIGQGAGGALEGTPPSKQYGAGDGVMIAGDVRSLAREYCSRGVRVKYQQYPLSHFTSVAEWLPAAYSWMLDRFAGKTAPTSCGSIKPGNSLAPLKILR